MHLTERLRRILEMVQCGIAKHVLEGPRGERQLQHISTNAVSAATEIGEMQIEPNSVDVICGAAARHVKNQSALMLPAEAARLGAKLGFERQQSLLQPLGSRGPEELTNDRTVIAFHSCLGMPGFARKDANVR